MPLKEREILELAERVESITNKMDELEYEKNVTKRMRNIIMREFGKRVDDLKVEPFEVMLKKVQEKASETVKRDLSVELNKNFETVLVELMKQFRQDFTKEAEKRDKESKATITSFSKEMTEMKNILEKKVALMEEDLFKKTTDVDGDMEELSVSIKEAMKNLKIKVSAIDEKVSTHTERLKAVEEDSIHVSKEVERVDKDVQGIDLEKEIGYLSRRFDSEISKIETDINSLRAFDKTLLEKDIAKIWDEIDAVKGETHTARHLADELEGVKTKLAQRSVAVDPKTLSKKAFSKLPSKKEEKPPQIDDKGAMHDLERLINDAFKIGRRKP